MILTGSQRRTLAWQTAGLLCGLVVLVGLASSLQVRATRSIVELTGNALAARQQIAAVTSVLDVLQDAERGQRGFLLTARPNYLEPYTGATSRLAPALATLREAARGSKWLRPETDALAELAEQKMSELEQSVALARSGDMAGALAIVTTARGTLLMDEARARVTRIGTRLDNDERVQAAALQDRQSRLGLATQAAAVLGVIALGLALLAVLINRARLMTTHETERLVGERLAAAIDRIRDGVAVFDRNGQLILRNVQLASSLGLPPEQVRLGQCWAGLLAAADHVPGLAAIEPGAEPAETLAGARTLELSRSVMPDGGTLLAVADISRRVKAEDTARQAQKMDVLGQMTGGVAHDFNNLLQVISANLELVLKRLARDAVPDSLVQSRLEAARAGVMRGARLTRHLLAFARRQPLAPEAIDPGRLMAGLDDLLRRTVGPTIELDLVIGSGLWAVRADPNQLENALLNLMLNARDAIAAGATTPGIVTPGTSTPGTTTPGTSTPGTITPGTITPGTITIEVTNAMLDDRYAERVRELTPGAFVVFAVTDTGLGMTAGQLARATEPFFTTKPEGQGTGLGLSMVFGFAKQSGGHLQMCSEPGRGTTAKLYLPRTNVPAQTEEPAVPENRQGQGELILLVEDEPAVRTSGADLLRGLGYSVVTAETPLAALTTIELGLHPHLLLTDVIMPGPVTARALAARAAVLVPGLPVLFTSGYAQDPIAHNGTLDPGIMLIAKPWALDEMARALRRALEQPRPVTLPRRVVLLVEDDPLIRLTTADTLTDLGYAVIEAEDGATALACAAQADVVVMDLGLPDMPGLDLAAALRGSRPALPIIIASGQAQAPDGYGWLGKPFGTAELKAALEQADPQ